MEETKLDTKPRNVRNKDLGRIASCQTFGDTGFWPKMTVWHPTYSKEKPYGDLSRIASGQRMHAKADEISVAFESARAVTQWAVGGKFCYSSIRIGVRNIDPALHPFELLSVTALDCNDQNLRALNIDQILAHCTLCYSGPVAYSRQFHSSVDFALESYGGGDLLDIEYMMEMLPVEAHRPIRNAALVAAKYVYTKHHTLISVVRAHLLKEGRLTWEEFKEILIARGLPIDGSGQCLLPEISLIN